MLDIAEVQLNYLPCPGDVVQDFIFYLADEAIAFGYGHALAAFTLDDMLIKARKYAEKLELQQDKIDRIRWWIDTLPWDEDKSIMLYIDW